jgi:hypothetical protein
MSKRNSEWLPDDLSEVAELLNDQRPEADPVQLDRIKQRALSSRRRQGAISRKGNGFMRKPALSLLLVVGMLGGGTGALAAVGGVPVNLPFHASSHGKGASNSQYCPPTSQNPGALKGPGVNCGNPKHKIPPGQAKKLGAGGLPPGLAKKFGPSAKNGRGNGHGHGHGNGNGHVNASSSGNGGGHGNGHGGNGNGHGGGNGNGGHGGNGNGGGHGGGKGHKK